MEISEKGLNLIKKYEGFRSKVYRDVAGVLTIGYGTTFYPNGKRVKFGDPPLTEEEATKILKQNLDFFERFVDSSTRDDITQGMFDALVSFTYNLGVGALRKSTLLRKVNSNPHNSVIRKEFMKWVFAGGQQLPGLVKRRADEADLYFS